MTTRDCKDSGRSRYPIGAGVSRLAVMLVVLAVAPLALTAPKKDKNEDGNYDPHEVTQVYQHTYDEVFQACQEAIERLGWFLTDKDTNKGTITGHNKEYFRGSGIFVFGMHIESLNTKPETRVTINSHWTKKKPWLEDRKQYTQGFEDNLSSTVQKVLSTYH